MDLISEVKQSNLELLLVLNKLISSLVFKLVEFKEGQKPTDLYDKKSYQYSNYIGGIND